MMMTRRATKAAASLAGADLPASAAGELVAAVTAAFAMAISLSRQHDAGVGPERHPGSVVPAQRILGDACRVDGAGPHHLPVVQPDVVNGDVTEIGDIVDLALDGVDGIGWFPGRDLDLLRPDGED